MEFEGMEIGGFHFRCLIVAEKGALKVGHVF